MRSVAAAHPPCWLARYLKSLVSDEQLVHMLSSVAVAQRLMLVAKQDTWQFAIKT
jgi:hypothetical protein